ncbi:YebC/PmpR family DNA-binding transcriptional regulator [Candidatus Saccharibacteria bacterium]|nr:YebC/PmpR family DNA-binding transcriptional regulator [Candidatus Saccharibacteria bacterium]
MAGHSKWATTHRHKAVMDAKRGAVFTKLGNLIAIAARNGADPEINSSLAMAIEKAKQANMPNDNIKRAIARVTDKGAAQMIEETYEAYGPGGVGIIIEVATDNKNRTFPEVRSVLTKNGGRIADPGSVMFQFKRRGVIVVEGSGEELLLAVLEAGAEDAEEDEGEIVVYIDMKELAGVRKNILDAGLVVKSAELQYVPSVMVGVEDEEIGENLTRVLDLLEDHDDVTGVYTNAE